MRLATLVAAEDPKLWKGLGVRRWELALAGSMSNLVNKSGTNSKPGSRSNSRPNSRPGSSGSSKSQSSPRINPSMTGMDAFAPPPMAFMRPNMAGGASKKKNKRK